MRRKEKMSIQSIKEKYTCLDLLGEGGKKVTGGYLYSCPWRDDRHPSLSITEDGKGWHDFATGEHGSVIDLAIKLWKVGSVKEVCTRFEKDVFSFPSPSPCENSREKEKAHGNFQFFEVVPLRSPALFAYLHNRKIDLAIAKQFLKEAHYSFRDGGSSYLYALAYGNDKGGYELRNALYKGATAPKGITTHLQRENAATVVFEGFFDLLSFATLCGRVAHNYLCLNSCVNAEAAVEVLKNMPGTLYLCLDNDDRGRETTKKILSSLSSAIDISGRFFPYKDVNDFLIEKRKKPPR